MSLQGQVQYSIAVTARKDPRAYRNMTQDVESFSQFSSFPNWNGNKSSERDGNIRPPDLPLEKPVCRSGSNS